MTRSDRGVPRRSSLAGGLVGLAVAAASGHALAVNPQPSQPLSPAQVQSLDQAIRLWLRNPADHRADAKSDYTVTPEGDRFRVTAKTPMAPNAQGTKMTGGGITALAQPLVGNRWSFDDVRMAAPLSVTSQAANGTSVTVTYALTGEAGHALVDPSLAAQSTFDSQAASAQGSMASNTGLSGVLHVGAPESREVWLPVGHGRVDDLVHADAHEVNVGLTDTAPKGTVGIAVQQFALEGAMRALSPARLADLIVTLRDDLPKVVPPGKSAPAPTSPPGQPGAPTKIAFRNNMTPARRAILRQIVGELENVAAAQDVRIQADGIAVVVSGRTVTLRSVAFSEGVSAPQGKSEAHLRLALEGLKAADMPPLLAAFMPHRLVIAPRLGGVPADALFELALRNLGDVPPTGAENRKALLTLLHATPATVGVDELSFDSGPALVQASGAVQVAGDTPQDLTGSAVVRAKGLDAFLRNAAANPVLKQTVPVLFLLKGIGAQEGDATVWRITYEDGKLAVNGTDLSMLRR